MNIINSDARHTTPVKSVCIKMRYEPSDPITVKSISRSVVAENYGLPDTVLELEHFLAYPTDINVRTRVKK